MVLILRSTLTLSWQRVLFHERYNSNVVNHRPQQVLLLHLGATVSYEIFLSLWIVWLHVAAIETVVSQINTFASSTGDFNIITLDHMKKLENLLSLRTPDTLTTIDLAGSQGLEGMKVDTVKPQKIVFVFPIGHGVIVFMYAQSSSFTGP